MSLLYTVPGSWQRTRRVKGALERGSVEESVRRLPLVDVKTASGWKDTQTLLTSYQQADDAGMLQVMSSPVQLRDRIVSGTG